MTGPAVAPTVAIVGAGVAGIACAERLRRAGMTVALFDKGRRPGGRCATRRAGSFTFDHGAQYFTVSDEHFRKALAGSEAASAIAPWPQAAGASAGMETAARWVGTPGMSSLAQHLAGDLPVRRQCRIVSVEGQPRRWRLRDEAGSVAGPFDAVVVAVPAPQAVPLLAAAPHFAARAGRARMAPCWALMLAFAEPLPTEVAAASIDHGALAWICHDGGKPGRQTAPGEAPATWVVHASPAWSRAHLELDPDEAATALLAAFTDALGVAGALPVHAAAHRWRYARVEAALDEPCLFDPALGLGACGDWCVGPRIEAAFLSGLAMAEAVLAG